MTTPVIALLGCKDVPTDAVQQYCRYLGAALQSHDFHLEIRRVPWDVYGWPDALDALRLQAASWRGRWVLVQYTALAWSTRGFPYKFSRVLQILKSAGARIAIVFHDVEPFRGPRLVDHLRTRLQLHTMRRALAAADLAIFTIPLEKLSWLSGTSSRTHFIPVGPNLPIPVPSEQDVSRARKISGTPTIGVFIITGGEPGARETRIILAAVRHAARKFGKLRLSVFGRHAELRKTTLREGLQDLPVEVSAEGVLDDHQVIDHLQAADVLLFVRAPISTRRSSAIAGIAAGVPMVAFAGAETSWPVTDAGVLLASPGNPAQLHEALIRVLSDPELRASLRQQNALAYRQHFSWPAIATRFATLLKSV
ncbi:MAG: glycosyltransferase [Candidatus Acidiferrales bacterium]